MKLSLGDWIKILDIFERMQRLGWAKDSTLLGAWIRDRIVDDIRASEEETPVESDED